MIPYRLCMLQAREANANRSGNTLIEAPGKTHFAILRKSVAWRHRWAVAGHAAAGVLCRFLHTRLR